MKRKQMVWRETNSFSKGLYLGVIQVGTVAVNATKLRNEIGADYRWSCLLPGLMRTHNITTATEADGMHSVQNAVDAWFDKVLEA